jgi:hypothetical protein
MLAVEGYDLKLLSVVLGSAAAIFKCLDRATRDGQLLMLERRNFTASSTYTVYTVYRTYRPNDDTWNDKTLPQTQGEG